MIHQVGAMNDHAIVCACGYMVPMRHYPSNDDPFSQIRKHIENANRMARLTEDPGESKA